MSAEWIAFVTPILRVLGFAPKVRDFIAKQEMKPTGTDRDVIVEYARWLDERRVFHAPMTSELMEACVGSLARARDRTGDAHAKVQDPVTRAVVGGLLDLLRGFLDTWEGVTTPRFQERGFAARDADQIATFLKELGELRVKVRLLVSVLAASDARLRDLKFVEGGE